MPMTLEDELRDWTDVDIAGYHLGLALGLLAGRTRYEVRGIFWVDNPLGNFLVGTLDSMVRIGALEYRDEPDHQYRWSWSPAALAASRRTPVD